MHRQHVDDVGPVVAMSVAVTEQLRGNRVTVGLVVGQNAAEVIAGLRVEHLEDGADVVVLSSAQFPSSPRCDQIGDAPSNSQRAE
jgi:hypothetical protein